MASPPDANGDSFVDIDNHDTDCFFISRFASDEPNIAGVVGEMDEAALIDWIAANPQIKFSRCDEFPSLTSTRKVSYEEAFRQMSRRLKKEGGKVVLSRHVSLFSTKSLIEVVEDYFTKSPSTFRYLCFTPESGVWFGATPEILIDHKTGTDEITTMALAGTRINTMSGVWDQKNIDEHNVVVDFITGILLSHGLDVSADEPTDLVSGNVTHLCTQITAKGTVKSDTAIINDLNPTPAVAGWPRQQSIKEIDVFETHQRRFYSGIVGIRDKEGLHVYVNLRCAFIAPATCGDGQKGWVYNLYAGGGLVASSNLEDEWTETENKMLNLASCLDKTIENPIDAQFLKQ